MQQRFFLLPVFFSLFLSCGSPSKKTVHLYTWSYYIPDYILEIFNEETNIRVIYDTYDSNETMFAKLATGNAGFDISVPSGDFVSVMIEKDMLMPLVHDKIPNFQKISPDVLRMVNFDPGNQYSVPYFIGAGGLNINTSKATVLDPSWAVFNNASLKNRMTMLNDMREALGAALKFLGYSVNTRNLQELQAAKAVLLSWKENLLKFDAESFGKDFANENVYIAQGYPEVVLKEIDEQQRENYLFALPKEGGAMYMDSFVVMKDSKHPNEAFELINFILRPEIYARIADEFHYPSLIPEADALRQRQPIYTIRQLTEGNFEFKENLGPMLSEYNKVWEEVLQN